MSKGIQLKKGNEAVYPNAYYKIGDLFLTTNSENPSIRFGGTWQLFCPGKTLVCVDTSDSDFNSVKKTGGAKTHTLTENQIPNHSHNLLLSAGIDIGVGNQVVMNGWLWSTNSQAIGGTIRPSGGGQAHNNLQPFITCYIWIRTA